MPHINSTSKLPEVPGHSQVLRYNDDRFRQFLRNGLWGTCPCCPRDNDNGAYPEFCAFADASVHHRTFEELVKEYETELKKFNTPVDWREP